jgi:hypothetical protein
LVVGSLSTGVQIDRNGDGKLSPDEIQRALGEKGITQNIAELLKQVDRDGNGLIDYDVRSSLRWCAASCSAAHLPGRARCRSSWMRGAARPRRTPTWRCPTPAFVVRAARDHGLHARALARLRARAPAAMTEDKPKPKEIVTPQRMVKSPSGSKWCCTGVDTVEDPSRK